MFEKVNPGHPDKMADRLAGAVVDLVYERAGGLTKANPRVACEVMAGHGRVDVQIETSLGRMDLRAEDIDPLIRRLFGERVVGNVLIAPQDAHLSENQTRGLRCGDNGIFRGCAPTHEQRLLTAIATSIYERYPTDGKYILNTRKRAEHFDEDYCIYGGGLTICQSHASEKDLKRMLNDFFMEDGVDMTHLNPDERRQKASGMQDSDGEHSEVWGTMIDELYHIGVIKGRREGEQVTLDSEHMYELEYHINPLGEWTGGINTDSGATNRKLGSDMGDGVTGGGLMGKDLSKADVSVNIVCYLKAVASGQVVTAMCSIGDESVTFRYADGSRRTRTATRYAVRWRPTTSGRTRSRWTSTNWLSKRRSSTD